MVTLDQLVTREKLEMLENPDKMELLVMPDLQGPREQQETRELKAQKESQENKVLLASQARMERMGMMGTMVLWEIRETLGNKENLVTVYREKKEQREKWDLEVTLAQPVNQGLLDNLATREMTENRAIKESKGWKVPRETKETKGDKVIGGHKEKKGLSVILVTKVLLENLVKLEKWERMVNLEMMEHPESLELTEKRVPMEKIAWST
ncbi:MAG: hypothetical protein CMJ52_09830 [Planctomycetaceae bacterium]|nr:hypothetical protein [Planctomycetaceae bacterium]